MGIRLAGARFQVNNGLLESIPPFVRDDLRDLTAIIPEQCTVKVHELISHVTL